MSSCTIVSSTSRGECSRLAQNTIVGGGAEKKARALPSGPVFHIQQHGQRIEMPVHAAVCSRYAPSARHSRHTKSNLPVVGFSWARCCVYRCIESSVHQQPTYLSMHLVDHVHDALGSRLLERFVHRFLALVDLHCCARVVLNTDTFVQPQRTTKSIVWFSRVELVELSSSTLENAV